MIAGHVWLDGWGVLVWLASAAFWILVIAGIVALVRGHRGSAGGSAGGSALRLLEERYARGEISREEFFERRSTLSSPPVTAPSPPPEQRRGDMPAAAEPDQGEAGTAETKPLRPPP
jgi:putative membrane protein